MTLDFLALHDFDFIKHCVILAQKKYPGSETLESECEMKYLIGIGLTILGIGLLGYSIIKGKGYKITSWWRTPEHNAAIGGKPTSWHLIGLAYDVTPATESVNQDLQKFGFHTLNEGDHIHVQWFPAAKS